MQLTMCFDGFDFNLFLLPEMCETFLAKAIWLVYYEQDTCLSEVLGCKWTVILKLVMSQKSFTRLPRALD